MALSQTLQQKLLQKLSPQQIQLMKLLQIPTANLEERIKEELEENPALDISNDVSDGDDEVADYKLRDDNYPELEDKKTMPFKIESSFHETLLDQLGMLSLDEKS